MGCGTWARGWPSAGRGSLLPWVSREQGLLGILLPLNLTTEEERVDRERLAPETQYGKRTESELLETATWQAPSWISVPPILTSNRPLSPLQSRALPQWPAGGASELLDSAGARLPAPNPPHGPPEPGAC